MWWHYVGYHAPLNEKATLLLKLLWSRQCCWSTNHCAQLTQYPFSLKLSKKWQLFDFRSSFNWRKTFFFRHKNPQNSAILQNFPRLKRYFIASNIARYTMVYCLVCKLFEKCFKIASNFWSEHLELLASYVWSRNDLMRSSINWEGKRGTLAALSLSVKSV